DSLPRPSWRFILLARRARRATAPLDPPGGSFFSRGGCDERQPCSTLLAVRPSSFLPVVRRGHGVPVDAGHGGGVEAEALGEELDRAQLVGVDRLVGAGELAEVLQQAGAQL